MTVNAGSMAQDAPPGRDAKRILLLLYLGYLLSFADRVIFGMVLEPIQKTLGFSDSELGLLSGAAFAVSYAVFSPVAGFLVDRGSRKRFMAAAIGFWSLMTAATGIATSFVGMAFARIGVGAGEAFLHPLSVSLVSDTVSPARRARAFAFYMSAGAVGSMIALLCGGLLIHKLELLDGMRLPLLGRIEPWEGLFLAASIPGFLLAAWVLFRMKEPARSADAEAAHAPAPGERANAIAFLKRNRLLCWALFPGISLMQMSAYTMTTWKVTFFERVHGWTGSEAALWLGAVGGPAAILGCLSAGRIIGWLKAKGYTDAPLRMCVFSVIVYASFSVMGLLASGPFASLGLFAAAFFCSYVPSVAAFSAMGEVLPPNTRAQLAGLHTLTNGLISNSLGPFLVGFFSDTLYPFENGLRYAMLTTVLIGGSLGLLSILSALSAYRRRMAEMAANAAAQG